MIHHDIAQYSADWWELRRGVPTASQFHRIMTPAKRQYAKGQTGAEGYINELVGDLYDPGYGTHDDHATAAMRQGHVLEPEARRFYEFSRETTVTNGGICLTDDGTLGASPDGLVGDDGVLEVKSPIPKTQVAWLRAGTIPAKHLPQVHGHLVVTGRAWCDWLSYSPGLPPMLIRVVPDDYTSALVACLGRFVTDLAQVRERIAAIEWQMPERAEPVVFC